MTNGALHDYIITWETRPKYDISKIQVYYIIFITYISLYIYKSSLQDILNARTRGGGNGAGSNDRTMTEHNLSFYTINLGTF